MRVVLWRPVLYKHGIIEVNFWKLHGCKDCHSCKDCQCLRATLPYRNKEVHQPLKCRFSNFQSHIHSNTDFFGCCFSRRNELRRRIKKRIKTTTRRVHIIWLPLSCSNFIFIWTQTSLQMNSTWKNEHLCCENRGSSDQQTGLCFNRHVKRNWARNRRDFLSAMSSQYVDHAVLLDFR